VINLLCSVFFRPYSKYCVHYKIKIKKKIGKARGKIKQEGVEQRTTKMAGS